LQGNDGKYPLPSSTRGTSSFRYPFQRLIRKPIPTSGTWTKCIVVRTSNHIFKLVGCFVLVFKFRGFWFSLKFHSPYYWFKHSNLYILFEYFECSVEYNKEIRSRHLKICVPLNVCCTSTLYDRLISFFYYNYNKYISYVVSCWKFSEKPVRYKCI